MVQHFEPKIPPSPGSQTMTINEMFTYLSNNMERIEKNMATKDDIKRLEKDITFLKANVASLQKDMKQVKADNIRIKKHINLK